MLYKIKSVVIYSQNPRAEQGILLQICTQTAPSYIGAMMESKDILVGGAGDNEIIFAC